MIKRYLEGKGELSDDKEKPGTLERSYARKCCSRRRGSRMGMGSACGYEGDECSASTDCGRDFGARHLHRNTKREFFALLITRSPGADRIVFKGDLLQVTHG